MFQVPEGGGYSMSFNDVMDLTVDWKINLLEKAEEWFEEYARAVGRDT